MEHKLCVLIDFENVAAGTEKEGLGRFDIRAVFRRLKDKGRILVSRGYGDWGRFARFKQKLLEEGVTMVELTSYRGQEKNRADIALVVDAMEIAFTRAHVDTFVLLSGDSDFTPLVMRLKELDKRVIGIGTRGSTSRLLLECCDEFIFYDTIRKAAMYEDTEEEYDEGDHGSAPAPSRPSAVAAPSKELIFSLLAETVAGIQRDEPGPVQGGLIKQSILRKAPAFDETECGFASFARFLEAAQSRGLVRLIRDERAGGYRVDLPSAPAPVAPDVSDAAPQAASQSAGAHGGAMAAHSGGAERGEETEEAPTGPLPAVPELRGEAFRLQQVLLDKGVVPVGHMERHTVVHEFVDHVIERQQRKKRNTLTYVYGDIARRCRKTDPVVHASVVRAVIDGLKYANELRHASGDPIRSPTANFVLQREAEDLLESLRRFYVRTLLESGESLRDATALSELLWNDDKHAHESGELVAWLQHDMARRQVAESRPVPENRPSVWTAEPVYTAESPSRVEVSSEPAPAVPVPVVAAPPPETPAPSPAGEGVSPETETMVQEGGGSDREIPPIVDQDLPPEADAPRPKTPRSGGRGPGRPAGDRKASESRTGSAKKPSAGRAPAKEGVGRPRRNTKKGSSEGSQQD